jgi:hypothetical protein
MHDPYRTGSVSNGPYSVPTRGVNFRKEFKNLMHKTNHVATWLLYRRVRLDGKGLPVKHPDAYSNRSGEIPVDILPMHSTNDGYLYDDYIVQGFMNHSQAYSITNRYKSAGESSVDYKAVYFEWDFLIKASKQETAMPTNLDKVIRLKQDPAGLLTSPTEIIEHYDILSADPYRLDNGGRIEYHRIRVISVVSESFQQ